MAEKSFWSDFRRFFGRGLAILLPSILTLWLLWQIALFVFFNVATPINKGIRLGVISVVPIVFEDTDLPDWFRVTDADADQLVADRRADPLTVVPTTDEARLEIRRFRLREYWQERWYLEATGLLVAIVAIYFVGVLLSNFLGRKIYASIEQLVSKVPGFKQIYPHVKQLVDLVLGEKKMAFQKVVLVEYPGPGIWSIGFLTSDSVRQIDEPVGGPARSVFIPNSPTPFTGFTINVREDKLIPLDLTVDQALRFIITAGVLTPESTANGKTPPLPYPTPETTQATNPSPAPADDNESKN